MADQRALQIIGIGFGMLTVLVVGVAGIAVFTQSDAVRPVNEGSAPSFSRDHI